MSEEEQVEPPEGTPEYVAFLKARRARTEEQLKKKLDALRETPRYSSDPAQELILTKLSGDEKRSATLERGIAMHRIIEEAIAADKRTISLALKSEYVRGRTEAFRELQQMCVAHGGVFDATTHTVIDADQLQRRLAEELPDMPVDPGVMAVEFEVTRELLTATKVEAMRRGIDTNEAVSEALAAWIAVSGRASVNGAAKGEEPIDG